MVALPNRPDLVTISTPNGVKFTVARAHQDAFQGLVNDLEAGGYVLDPKTSGGYNRRYIAGTTTPSEHSFGRAIDVNWNDNPRGQRGKIPADVAQTLAAKHGMTWGGTWKNPDDMHFEVARAKADGYTSTGAPGFKSGLRPTPRLAEDVMPGAPPVVPAEPTPAAPTGPPPDLAGAQANLAAGQEQADARVAYYKAIANQNNPFLSGANSLGSLLTQGMQPAQPDPQPIILPPGAPLPLGRRIS